MTDFDRSQWAKPEFAQGYRDSADVCIVERRRLLEIVKSFYEHFIGDQRNNSVLDLGCGDGIIIHELLRIDGSIAATLMDGSEDMLNEARDRLKEFENTRFARASFQEILNKNVALHTYDFVVSSLAIHHLAMEHKTALFRTVHSHLNTNGYFLNIDVILAPSDALEKWYLLLWKKWIDERKSSLGIEDNRYDDIIGAYKDKTNDKPDTLGAQLRSLQAIGFKDVDCFYKYGIFAVYGGRK